MLFPLFAHVLLLGHQMLRFGIKYRPRGILLMVQLKTYTVLVVDKQNNQKSLAELGRLHSDSEHRTLKGYRHKSLTNVYHCKWLSSDVG